MSSEDGPLGEEVVDDADLVDVFGPSFRLAKQYHDILATDGTSWGLIGPREADRLWSRHIMNSAAIAALIPMNSSVVDVGSGAGLPGIPLALARDDLRVTLIDSMLRRVKFLNMTVAGLGLDGKVEVVRSRAEEWSNQYDVVVARAVAPLEKLIGWCAPLMVHSMIALKGDGAEEEVNQARAALRRFGLRATVKIVQAGNGFASATAVQITKS